MQIISSSGRTLFLDLQVDGAGSAIEEGALIMPGVTDETDRSVFIKASGAGADAIGILKEAHAAGAAYDPAPDTGLVYDAGIYKVQVILPGDMVAAEMSDSASDDVDVASFTTATPTITNLEDDIDGSWAYVRDGTSVGLLAYIKESAAGSCVFKSTPTTALDNTSKLIIMRKIAHQLVSINSAATKIASSAAAGSLPWRVLRNQVKLPGSEGWVNLDYTKHDNLTGLNVTGFALRQILVPADTFFNPLD